MPAFRYVICDVFTERPLAGNQLAVFTVGHEVREDLLQPLAREINFSETVFVYPPRSGGHARIRIFTPGSELPFAGHPVLGTAFVLATQLQLSEIVLETGAGLVPIRLEQDGPRIRFGRMTQPLPSIEPFRPEAELLRALGVVRSELPVEMYVNGPRHVYVKLASEADVARLAPDFGALARLPLCHLARHGLIRFRDEIEVTQGAEIGRPSTLYARVEGSRERIEKVEVGGAAVIVGHGEFQLDV
jgi:trans-2,3-dihydro-3-hydroxyanthranilate isomerase